MYVLSQVVSIILVYNLIGKDAQLYLEVGAFSYIVCNLFVAISILFLVYITVGLNKPLTTRKDFHTGKDISLLMFVSSNIQRRKIFDQDADREQTQINNFDEEL